MFGAQEFSSYAAKVLRQVATVVEGEIGEFSEEFNEAEYYLDLENRFKLDGLQLQFEQISVETREERIPARRHPSFDFFVREGESYLRQVIRYFVPFEGAEELLGCIPDPSLVWTHEVGIEDGNIFFDVIDFYSDAERIKTSSNQILDPMRKQSENLATNIDTFNEQLPGAIRKFVAEQKEKLQRQNQVVENLGFPVREARETISGEDSSQMPNSQDETRGQRNTAQSDNSSYEWDVFVSHASEDKQGLVEELVKRLVEEGVKVWYDDFTLSIGDHLRRSIDRGLSSSRFGIVILSHNFFTKEWPQNELDGLATRERNGEKVILPVWFEIAQSEVAGYSPMLADRVAARADLGIDNLVADLIKVLRP